MTDGTTQRRRSEGALAAVTRADEAGHPLWLSRWNAKWGCYYFVGGHRHADETYAACLEREIREELGLGRGRDYELTEPALKLVQFAAWSKRAKAETDYEMAIFAVQFRPGVEALLFDPKRRLRSETGEWICPSTLRWLTPEEIRSKCCRDGKPVSETMATLLEKIGWQVTGGK